MAKQPKIGPETKVGDVVQHYPEALEVLLNMGFEPLRNPIARKTVAKLFTLQQAAAFKGIEVDELLGALRRAVGQVDEAEPAAPAAKAETSREVPDLTGDLRVMGLVPCPVRGPLVELIDTRVREMTAATGLTIPWWVAGEGPAGEDVRRWLANKVRRDDWSAFPEIFLGVGTELLYHRTYGELARKHFWGPFPGEREPRPELEVLEDPRGILALQFCVPFCWSCRPDRLPSGLPKTWSDLADPGLAGEVALPSLQLPIVPDLLLTLNHHLGEKCFTGFARNVWSAMHPAEAGRRVQRSELPAITIMPDHFASGSEAQGAQRVVPDDGFVILPAYVAVRASAPKEAAELATFLCSKEYLEPLWKHGRFVVNHRRIGSQIDGIPVIARPLESMPFDPEKEAKRLFGMLSVGAVS